MTQNLNEKLNIKMTSHIGISLEIQHNCFHISQGAPPLSQDPTINLRIDVFANMWPSKLTFSLEIKLDGIDGDKLDILDSL